MRKSFTDTRYFQCCEWIQLSKKCMQTEEWRMRGLRMESQVTLMFTGQVGGSEKTGGTVRKGKTRREACFTKE